MTHRADPAELFNIKVDELAWFLAFITPDRFGRLQGTELVQSQSTQNPTHGGGRDAALGSYLLDRPTLSTRSLNLFDNRLLRRLSQSMRPRRASKTVLDREAALSRTAAILDALSTRFSNRTVTCHGGAIEKPRRLRAVSTDRPALARLRRRLVGGTIPDRKIGG